MADAPVAPPVVALGAARRVVAAPVVRPRRAPRRASAPRSTRARSHRPLASRPTRGEPVARLIGVGCALRADRGAARHRPDDRARRDRRGHGPQRCGEVDAAAPALRAHAPDRRARHASTARAPHSLPAAALVRKVGLVPVGSGRAALRTHHRVGVLGRRPRAQARRPEPRAPRSTASSPGSTRTTIPATSPRANGSRSRSRWCSRPRRR